ncbi:hypothetical protein AVEN_228740-1 [Araneus ventricosus]|uniref:Uncharacterized protein n=1 Tax=Araneus ventricosus TaxID=182803 RepID=A0A4Y2Q4S1_ARAVE|nr:hypothetical protein AVEN_228740-1 [Araneus ventricosus]
MVSSSSTEIPILLAKLKNCCESSSGKSKATPYSPDSAPNLGSENLSGTRFSSDSDVKTVVENWLNGQNVISAKPGSTIWSCFQINAEIDLTTFLDPSSYKDLPRTPRILVTFEDWWVLFIRLTSRFYTMVPFEIRIAVR